MAKKKWKDLSNQQKGVVVATTAVDMGLRTWAGRDLASRTQEPLLDAATSLVRAGLSS